MSRDPFRPQPWLVLATAALGASLACGSDEKVSSSNGDGGSGGSAALGGASGVAGVGGSAGSDAAAGGGGSAGVVPSAWQDDLIREARYTLNGEPGPSFVEITDVEVSKDRVYVCTATQGFLVVDRSMPDLPVQFRGSPSAGTTRCQNVSVLGSRTVIANRGDEYAPDAHVTLYDTSVPDAPVELASITDDSASFEGVELVDDRTIAVALHGDGVALLRYDAATSGIAEISRVTGFDNAWDLALSGDHLWVADASYGIRAIYIGDPLASSVVAGLALDGSTKHVELGVGLAFASSGASGVHAVDISNPLAPALISTTDTPGSALMSALAGNVLFVADWNDVRGFDVSEPAQPVLVTTENISTGSFSRVLALDAVADRAYLGEWTGLYDYRYVPDVSAPDLRVAAFAAQFPDTPPGAESAVSVVLENEGDRPLTVLDVNADQEFSPLQDQLVIQPGAKDFIEVRFRPTKPSPTTALLQIVSDDPDENIVGVTLQANSSGFGVGDPVPVDEPRWEWVDVQSGQPLSLKSLAGKVVLLSYFATF